MQRKLKMDIEGVLHHSIQHQSVYETYSMLTVPNVKVYEGPVLVLLLEIMQLA